MTFSMLFPGAETANVRQVVFGKPFTFNQPRGPLGRDETNPVFKRGASLGATSNLEFTTPAFVVPNEPLRVNIDIAHGPAALTQGAYLMCEVLDEKGQVVRGYERVKSLTGNVDALDWLLQWNGNTTQPLAGQRVSLHFLIRDARLYALHTQKAPERVLQRLRLSVAQPALSSGATTRFELRGETASGEFVPLREPQFALVVSDPDLVIARPDRRDPHEGTVTAFAPVASPQNVTLQAEVVIGNRKLSSNAVELRVAPAPKVAPQGFKLLFTAPEDAHDATGVTFEPNRLGYYAETRGVPTSFKAMALYNRKVGEEYHVWGSTRGNEGFVFRATTRDGLNYSTQRVQTTMHPQHFMTMVYHRDREEYIAFERKSGPPRWQVHTSKDGLNFTAENEAYQDFDGLHLFYDEAAKQIVGFQLSFEPTATPRRYPDNLGALSTQLGNKGRRVFWRRTSADGRTWTPNGGVDQAKPETWTKPEFLSLAPDANDPPDYECYWLNVFRHGERYLGQIMWYAPASPEFLRAFPYDSPQTIAHGPHVTTEWITSDDLKTWQRPFRNIRATDDVRIYFMNAPIVVGDRMLFLVANQNYSLGPERAARNDQNIELYSLPLDRLISAGGTNAAFSTPVFTVPSAPLHLNATGNLAVEVLDETGTVVPGYERDGSALTGLDAMHHKLTWRKRDTASLAGRKVRLRFHLNGARVYSVHAGGS